LSTRIESLTGLGPRAQAPAFLVALGHGATHWLQATLYLLLPFITEALNITYVQAGLLITLFHASSFGANFFSGLIVDVTGKRVLIQFAALVIGALAMMSFSLTSEFWVLAIPVMIIGMTNNLWHPAAISYLSGNFPDNRGYVLSIHTLGASLGDSVAPLVVGSLLLALTWQQSAAASTLPVFVIAVLLIVLLSRSKSGAKTQTAKGMSSSEYFSGLKEIFLNKPAMGLCLMAGFRSMAQNGLLMFIPIYLANVLKVGPFITGLGMFALQLGGFIAGPLAGAWSDRVGRRPVVVAGITATTLIVILLTVSGNEAVFIGGVSILGFALFAIRPVIHSWMMDMTPPEMAGSATSALFGSQSALSMLVPVLGGWVADQYGVGAVFYLLAACMLAANAVVFMLPKGPSKAS